MRIALKNDMQRQFLREAISLSRLKNIRSFSESIGVSNRTFENWLYEDRLLPESIFEKLSSIYPTLSKYKEFIIEIKEDSWGKVLGGKKTYKTIIEKYGIEEIRRRQAIGGRKSRRLYDNKDVDIDFNNKLFLEFYGALIGDGWMSSLAIKNTEKRYWIIGFSGHLLQDRNYLEERIKPIVSELFSRKGYIRYKEHYNCLEYVFGYKQLIKKLNEELEFPIGLKLDLKIHNKFLGEWKYMKYIIRGLFDTDGSLYFDKDKRYNKLYPIIEISSASEALLNQVAEALCTRGFRVIICKRAIRLKGEAQLEKWFREIRPKNNKHVFKYKNHVKIARVA